MKLNKILFCGIVLATMGLTSCVGDMDLLPTNPKDTTSGNFSEDPEQYMREVLADVYLNVSTFGANGNNILGSMDGGMSTFMRAVFNMEEVPTDEANWQPTADAIPHSLSYGQVAANETFVLGTYQRMMVASSLCNQFIQTDFQLTTPEQEALREEFVRQCKIIRSGMYFYLVSLFGNVPLNDENVMIGEVAPQLSTDFATGRRLVTENVVNTLEEIVAWYKDNNEIDPNTGARYGYKPPYGYVGLDVAQALLVKFYLNYEVFTGKPAWDLCLDNVKDLLSRLGNGGFNNTGLANNYFQCFSWNNRSDSENEIIWRIPQVTPAANTGNTVVNGTPSVGVQSWANGGFLISAYIDNTDESQPFKCKNADYNSGNGWKCMSARRQFVEVFPWNADYTVSSDPRTDWWKTAADGFNINNEDLTQESWGNNGFLPVKFTNWYIDNNGNKVPELSPDPVDPNGIDYGMIRLAEIYLSGAEAALHLRENATALDYVNYIRERAGVTKYTTIGLTELQNERQRELYSECTRRTDLIRYGKWISGYNWNWKNGAHDGVDFPERFIVYPMPTTVVSINGYVQNPGW